MLVLWTPDKMNRNHEQCVIFIARKGFYDILLMCTSFACQKKKNCINIIYNFPLISTLLPLIRTEHENGRFILWIINFLINNHWKCTAHIIPRGWFTMDGKLISIHHFNASFFFGNEFDPISSDSELEWMTNIENEMRCIRGCDINQINQRFWLIHRTDFWSDRKYYVCTTQQHNKRLISSN